MYCKNVGGGGGDEDTLAITTAKSKLVKQVIHHASRYVACKGMDRKTIGEP